MCIEQEIWWESSYVDFTGYEEDPHELIVANSKKVEPYAQYPLESDICD